MYFAARLFASFSHKSCATQLPMTNPSSSSSSSSHCGACVNNNNHPRKPLKSHTIKPDESLVNTFTQIERRLRHTISLFLTRLWLFNWKITYNLIQEYILLIQYRTNLFIFVFGKCGKSTRKRASKRRTKSVARAR